jgi:hypothetical protein
MLQELETERDFFSAIARTLGFPTTRSARAFAPECFIISI